MKPAGVEGPYLSVRLEEIASAGDRLVSQPSSQGHGVDDHAQHLTRLGRMAIREAGADHDIRLSGIAVQERLKRRVKPHVRSDVFCRARGQQVTEDRIQRDPELGSAERLLGTTRPVRTGTRSSAVALAVPVADPFDDRERPGGAATPGALVAAPSPADRRRLPRYKIRPQETLRSIARDVLGDSRRAGEILELNRGAIDDPSHLTPGQEIELPEDARLTRRGRSEP